MTQTVTQIIIAISLWCGQPQYNEHPTFHPEAQHAVNDMAVKNACQKSVMKCMGKETINWDGDKFYGCLMRQKWSIEK